MARKRDNSSRLPVESTSPITLQSDLTLALDDPRQGVVKIAFEYAVLKLVGKEGKEGHFPYFLHDRSRLWATLIGDTLLIPLRAGDDHCERRPEAGLLQPDVEPTGRQGAHLCLRHLLLHVDC
jgi:hypothetical protein